MAYRADGTTTGRWFIEEPGSQLSPREAFEARVRRLRASHAEFTADHESLTVTFTEELDGIDRAVTLVYGEIAGGAS